MSILNLTAVRRSLSLNETWQEEYLSDVLEIIPYGHSHIEVRAIGVDIGDVPDIEKILKSHDLIVVPISFETHIPELFRIAAFVKNKTADVPIMASGLGTWGHEQELLQAGFDCVFTGAVTDRGEEILFALLNQNYRLLSQIPGANFWWKGKIYRNLPPRSFWLTKEEKNRQVAAWQAGLHRYFKWVEPAVRMVGRPDLATGGNANPLLEYCCNFQDLPPQAAATQSRSGMNMILAALPMAAEGCPRECGFCNAPGKGFTTLPADWVINLINQFDKWSVTDLIPTDDQLVLAAASNTSAAQAVIAVLETIQAHAMKIFVGNGIETMSLLRMIQKAQSGPEAAVYQKLMAAFMDTLGYLYLPLEEEAVVIGERPKLRKLRMGLTGFEQVLDYVDRYSSVTDRRIEIATNVILKPEDGESEMRAFYERMSELASRHPCLTRFNCFSLIASEMAPDIAWLRNAYYNIASNHPVLKTVGTPQLAPLGQGPDYLENQLAQHLRVRAEYQTRRLEGGVYR